MKNIILVLLALVTISAAQGKKAKVSFKDEIMPIFQKKCLNCHNTEDESPSGLYLDSYAELMKGDSRHGPVVTAKKGEESIIIMKLRGTASFGKQMPRGKKPLEDEMIQVISTWIDQGAKNN
ncbi:MAG: c-type cytochrome domain-containing protein [Bacteroidota bacterium]